MARRNHSHPPENEAEANPTIATLTRYAEALGKRLMIVLANSDVKGTLRQERPW